MILMFCSLVGDSHTNNSTQWRERRTFRCGRHIGLQPSGAYSSTHGERRLPRCLRRRPHRCCFGSGRRWHRANRQRLQRWCFVADVDWKRCAAAEQQRCLRCQPTLDVVVHEVVRPAARNCSRCQSASAGCTCDHRRRFVSACGRVPVRTAVVPLSATSSRTTVPVDVAASCRGTHRAASRVALVVHSDECPPVSFVQRHLAGLPVAGGGDSLAVWRGGSGCRSHGLLAEFVGAVVVWQRHWRSWYVTRAKCALCVPCGSLSLTLCLSHSLLLHGGVSCCNSIVLTIAASHCLYKSMFLRVVSFERTLVMEGKS